MFNPNSNNQIAETIADDLGYLGMIVPDEWVNVHPDYVCFEVGNESITFCKVVVTQRGVTVTTNGITKRGIAIRKDGMTYKPITYKGSLERLSEEVCCKVVKVALKNKQR